VICIGAQKEGIRLIFGNIESLLKIDIGSFLVKTPLMDT